MPAQDEEVSVSSVIGVASAKANPGLQGSAVEKQATVVKPNKNGPSKRPGASDCKERIARLNQAHRMEAQAAKAKYREELKSMREALNEQAKKSKEGLRQATDGSKKFYEAQLKRIRTDYQNQNDALRTELKKFLEHSVKEIAENAEVRLSNDTNERLDRFSQMIHEEFINQMQKKADEIEQLRAQLEGKLAVTSQECQGRGHRITQLESRLKEVSHYLPDDVQQEIYEQFGFEDEVIELDEEPKEKRKGLFGRLASAL